jgi:hypothetical protein
MTRGCTEAWQGNPERAHWLELSKLNNGALLEFVDPWDIFPDGVIPAGTRATIAEQGLNELQPVLILKPVGVSFPFLANWDGEIWLHPDVRLGDHNMAGADEYTPAPVKIVEGAAA